MELIDQHTKSIMEGCKERARSAGLRFEDETLEYIVTNRDLLELSPKYMIPTLYDYWVHDVEILKEKGRYELYPSNPYETVINTRPAISFYNDNNPDWLNVMIFYHVLGHIDFFQNNLYYRDTWDYDFNGQALSDKRLISRLRSEKGRWVDYVIEFARGIDNLVAYHRELSRLDRPVLTDSARRLDFYFDIFLQNDKKVKVHEYIKEIERYNECVRSMQALADQAFFAEVIAKHPEFEVLYAKHREKRPAPVMDLLQFLMDNSEKLNKEENRWMKSILQVIRKTSIFFQPQIRTKIMNEGWASYWHETLFMNDDRIKGHEVDFARVNAGVTAMPRVGLNPYALGMRLFYYLEELGNKGKYTMSFLKIQDMRERKDYDQNIGKGREFIFKVRETLCDYLFISKFIDQDFVTRNNIFVAGKRLNKSRAVWEYYVKSRKAQDYRDMVIGALYHPPHITIDSQKSGKNLYLVHHFEGKPLVRDYIHNTMLGIEYLWGAPVQLETSEFVAAGQSQDQPMYPFMSGGLSKDSDKPVERRWQRVVYTMENMKLSRKTI